MNPVKNDNLNRFAKNSVEGRCDMFKNEITKNKTHFNFLEFIFHKVFLLSALTAVLCVLVITVFLFYMGLPAIKEVGLINFLFKKDWYPEAEIFGIFAMIINSVCVTFGAILIGVPIGIFTAIFMCEFAPSWLLKFMNPAIELLAGIPSVIYGFFGLVVIVPLISEHIGGAGNSLLAACLILGIMILPTIITISKTAILAVPKEFKEGAYALGASNVRTIFTVTLKAASSGVFSAIVLGVGRAVGETMAVILVAGNSNIIPSSITDPIKTMTANIALEMAYSEGLHQQALFATGVILFTFIMLLNIILRKIQSRES